MTGAGHPRPPGDGVVDVVAEDQPERGQAQHYRAGRLVRWLAPGPPDPAADLTVVLPAAAATVDGHLGAADGVGGPHGHGGPHGPAGPHGHRSSPSAAGARVRLRAADGRWRDLLGLTHGWRGEVVATPGAGGGRSSASCGGVLLDTPVGDVGFLLAVDRDGGVRTAYADADSHLCRSGDLSLVAPWAEVVRWLHDDERILGHLVVEGWPFDGDLFVLSMVEGVLCAPDGGGAPRLPARALGLVEALGRARADWTGRTSAPEEATGAD